MFKKILVALDHSPMARFIFDQALSLAREHHTSLKLVHILSVEEETFSSTDLLYGNPIYGAPGPTIGAAVWYEQWQVFKNQSLEQLQGFALEANQAGVEAECTQISGNPGKMICHLASIAGTDLILVGNRGRSGLNELLLGSVSNYVMHHAPCSVLIVKSPAKGEHSDLANSDLAKLA
ncbi:MAG: universal stress protein [Leptolyngbyaceae cyanobacterium CRU_2_3]|nr:universal stress protein [Leptolyngbyaceae cyanobacterium CRU_2_3]